MRCAGFFLGCSVPSSLKRVRCRHSSAPLLSDLLEEESKTHSARGRIGRASRFIQKIEEKRQSNSTDIFLIASFSLMVIEALSSSFTIYCLDYGANASVKAKVVVAYYALYAALSCILLVNAVLSAIRVRQAYKKKEINAKQQSVQLAGEALTITTGLMWITISLASITMALSSSVHMQLAAMCLAVMAPALGALSAFLRVYEVSVSYKKEKLDVARRGDSASGPAVMSQRRKNWYCFQSGLFLTIALFEFAHFLCHVYEAYLLQGNTHLLYNIQDRVLLGTQIFLTCVFILLEIAKVYTEKGAESPQSSLVNSFEDRSLGDNSNTPEYASTATLVQHSSASNARTAPAMA
ncbi:hypothetical protein AM324 [Anaplasma marginale str. St. Maries]|uniref:Uncharacterized protein n=1 Tax=Anaplasma marginale (strain Florida) TaxID=320483 RepID=B9KI04_ANAMF|nr:hypothetical protein AM324 [Anaplasma marginale str. St. Maries]ACM49116.1 Conserved hypothetical protein [Anaplasma marginale str. Florida]